MVSVVICWQHFTIMIWLWGLKFKIPHYNIDFFCKRSNAVNQETTFKRSLRQKRKRAAMNDSYMMLILKSLYQD